MNQEKRALLAGLLSFGILMGYYYFFEKGPVPPQKAPQQAAATSPGAATSGEAQATTPVTVQKPLTNSLPKAEVVIPKETPLLSMKWSNRGAGLARVELPKVTQTLEKDSPLVNLLNDSNQERLELTCEGCNYLLPSVDQYDLVSQSDNEVVFEASQDGVSVRRKYSWDPQTYLIDTTVTVTNHKDQAVQGRLGLRWNAKQLTSHPSKFGFLKGPDNQRTLVYHTVDDVFHEHKESVVERKENIPWAGIEDRYFLTAIITKEKSSEQSFKFKKENHDLRLSLMAPDKTIPPQGVQEENFSLYIGPKERDQLLKANVGLEKVVNYGWFSIVALPILKTLQFFHGLVKNWGVAIILLTLLVKVLMNPLTLKSMASMKEMKNLQPKIIALKEKYKNNKERLNAETMQLFREHKVNPIGGCLPMLLQMPIYIALYKVLYNAIELYHAPFFGFYRDLSGPDPYFIMPILLGVAMVLQQKMMPNPSADPVQKQMMTIMPIMFTGFMLFLPVGLVLYIFVNTVTGVLQQYMYQNNIRWRDVLRGKFQPQSS